MKLHRVTKATLTKVEGIEVNGIFFERQGETERYSNGTTTLRVTEQDVWTEYNEEYFSDTSPEEVLRQLVDRLLEERKLIAATLADLGVE